MYTYFKNPYPGSGWSRIERSLYNGLNRNAFVMGMSGLLYLLFHGWDWTGFLTSKWMKWYSKIINYLFRYLPWLCNFLSMKIFSSLSTLTYGTYLIHPLIMFIWCTNATATEPFYFLRCIFYTVGFGVIISKDRFSLYCNILSWLLSHSLFVLV